MVPFKKKKIHREDELIALNSLQEEKKNNTCFGFFVCVAEIFSCSFLFPLQFRYFFSFPLAEEQTVVDGDIITQSGVCSRFPVIWTFA